MVVPPFGNQFLVGSSLPPCRVLAPYESFECTVVYEGVQASSREDDVVVTASFVESGTGVTFDAEDRLTVVRVEIRSTVDAPENDCRNRHKFGVCEAVEIVQDPLASHMSLRCDRGMIGANGTFICPLDAATDPVTVVLGGVEYTPNITVMEPDGIEARDVMARTYGVATNYAGGVGMVMSLYVLPLDVSFSRIAVEEVPCDRYVATGYFSNPRLSYLWGHSHQNGAGIWNVVDVQNRLEHADEPRIETALPRVTEDGMFVDDLLYGWMDGRMTWEIPFGWSLSDVQENDPEHKQFATDTIHEAVIFTSGMSGVRKLRNMVVRHIDGSVYLNGVMVAIGDSQ